MRFEVSQVSKSRLGAPNIVCSSRERTHHARQKYNPEKLARRGGRGGAVSGSADAVAAGAGFALRREADGAGERQATGYSEQSWDCTEAERAIAALADLHRRRGQAGATGELLRKEAGDFGAGLLPVSHALLGGVERADERLADGELCSRQGLQRDRDQHRPYRDDRFGGSQEARLPETLRASGNGRGLALHDRHAGEHRRADQGGRFWLREDSRAGWEADTICARQRDSDRNSRRQAGAVLHGRGVLAQGFAAGTGGGLGQSHRLAGG